MTPQPQVPSPWSHLLPFVRIRRANGQPQVEGAPTVLFGEGRNAATGVATTRPGRGDDGVWALWNWDGVALRARASWNGFQPLFYWADQHQITMSPSVTTLLLLGAPQAPDRRGWSAFGRLGFFLGEDTPFASIRALPPDADLSWTDGVLSVSGRLVIPEQSGVSRDDAIDAFVARFRESVARRVRPGDRIVVPLSGGRDSRHILLAMLHGGVTPTECVTVENHPPRSNEDARVASLVAHRAGVPHCVLPQQETIVGCEQRKNLLCGWLSDEHIWALPLARYVHGRFDSLFDGIAGDVLSAGLFQTPRLHALARSGQFGEIARELYSPSALRVVARQGAEWRHDESAALDRIVEELRRHADAPNPMASFYFWNRTRREIGLLPFAMLATVGHVHAPFLDRQVFDLLAALPAQHVMDRTFHAEALHRGYPAFREVPFETKGDVSNGRAFRRVAMELLPALGSGAFLRKSYVLPRLIRVAADPRYAPTAAVLAPAVTALAQLDLLAQGGVPAVARGIGAGVDLPWV